MKIPATDSISQEALHIFFWEDFCLEGRHYSFKVKQYVGKK